MPHLCCYPERALAEVVVRHGFELASVRHRPAAGGGGTAGSDATSDSWTPWLDVVAVASDDSGGLRS
jgi:hypothetical protein